MGLGRGHFLGRGGEGGGNQQRLAGDLFCRIDGILELLVDDALVRRMHVHHDHALGILGQYVHAVDLGDGAAQGPDGLVGRCRGRCG